VVQQERALAARARGSRLFGRRQMATIIQTILTD
jgi:hypothetical protein